VNRDRLYLENILERILRIREFTALGRDKFFNDELTQDAVIRNLEVIGEAVKRLSPEVRLENPDIPWKSIAGLRDFLIHEYLYVDLDQIWAVLEGPLDDLMTVVEGLLARGDGT
jgi:uncharacterized protein with HEPN domain